MASDLIVIAGPTASGKSDLALNLAQHLRDARGVEAEIINADSVQLYNELKTLTAYPSDDMLKSIPHRLYGILSPRETSSVAAWLDLAEKEIARLRKENKTAIICGGTGFYISALLNGISNIPKIPQDFRNKVARKFKEVGKDEFFDLLIALDPEICGTLNKNDTQRVLRAYEVASFTGKPLSSWQKEGCKAKREASSIVLLPPRDKLNEKCLLRIEKMIEAGVIDEVRDFVERYPNYDGPLRAAVGYREIISFLNNAISLDECVQLISFRTRQYAKRQSTWFRNQMKSAKIICEFGSKIACDLLIREERD
ncbi:MAG: tRNA (adenosine(37)-N6)-dimethylallyltransferase MiaA [Holosporaceae bacterium]|nr:tRNA (adenosine(37)-N6)-dimethylallyltransferase MiaA [Holosporaceae bacterium]